MDASKFEQMFNMLWDYSQALKTEHSLSNSDLELLTSKMNDYYQQDMDNE